VVFFRLNHRQSTVNYRVLGWPSDGPRLRLDYRVFAYAGKFVMSTTGKAVVTDPDAEPTDWPEEAKEPAGEDREYTTLAEPIVAAVAFNEDRTDETALWIRYVTVRTDRRGEGLGGRLAAFLTDCAAERGYETVRIAVNNPFSYQALYKAGFEYTARETGLAEVVLERPAATVAPCDPQRYRAGLERFAEREDLDPAERSFLDERLDGYPPELLDWTASEDEAEG
jgi:GNAT superfamily N-acetyltransferase